MIFSSFGIMRLYTGSCIFIDIIPILMLFHRRVQPLIADLTRFKTVVRSSTNVGMLSEMTFLRGRDKTTASSQSPMWLV